MALVQLLYWRVVKKIVPASRTSKLFCDEFLFEYASLNAKEEAANLKKISSKKLLRIVVELLLVPFKRYGADKHRKKLEKLYKKTTLWSVSSISYN